MGVNQQGAVAIATEERRDLDEEVGMLDAPARTDEE